MRKLLALVAAGVICGVAALTSSGPAEARLLNDGDRYWDRDAGKMRTFRKARPGAGGSYSNRSPIRKRKVSIDGQYAPNTIIVDTGERRLYYVYKRGKAIKYGIGVGRDGFQWSGTHKITRKAEWPDWRPPAEMIRRVKRENGVTLKSFYEGGPNNPLGARAMYIGSTIYRIHGTNQPWTIGKAMSSGCIRLANSDVEDLYERVQVGAKVIVKR